MTPPLTGLGQTNADQSSTDAGDTATLAPHQVSSEANPPNPSFVPWVLDTSSAAYHPGGVHPSARWVGNSNGVAAASSQVDPAIFDALSFFEDQIMPNIDSVDFTLLVPFNAYGNKLRFTETLPVGKKPIKAELAADPDTLTEVKGRLARKKVKIKTDQGVETREVLYLEFFNMTYVNRLGGRSKPAINLPSFGGVNLPPLRIMQLQAESRGPRYWMLVAVPDQQDLLVATQAGLGKLIGRLDLNFILTLGLHNTKLSRHFDELYRDVIKPLVVPEQRKKLNDNKKFYNPNLEYCDATGCGPPPNWAVRGPPFNYGYLIKPPVGVLEHKHATLRPRVDGTIRLKAGTYDIPGYGKITTEGPIELKVELWFDKVKNPKNGELELRHNVKLTLKAVNPKEKIKVRLSQKDGILQGTFQAEKATVQLGLPYKGSELKPMPPTLTLTKAQADDVQIQSPNSQVKIQAKHIEADKLVLVQDQGLERQKNKMVSFQSYQVKVEGKFSAQNLSFSSPAGSLKIDNAEIPSRKFGSKSKRQAPLALFTYRSQNGKPHRLHFYSDLIKSRGSLELKDLGLVSRLQTKGASTLERVQLEQSWAADGSSKFKFNTQFGGRVREVMAESNLPALKKLTVKPSGKGSVVVHDIHGRISVEAMLPQKLGDPLLAPPKYLVQASLPKEYEIKTEGRLSIPPNTAKISKANLVLSPKGVKLNTTAEITGEGVSLTGLGPGETNLGRLKLQPNSPRIKNLKFKKNQIEFIFTPTGYTLARAPESKSPIDLRFEIEDFDMELPLDHTKSPLKNVLPKNTFEKMLAVTKIRGDLSGKVHLVGFEELSVELPAGHQKKGAALIKKLETQELVAYDLVIKKPLRVWVVLPGFGPVEAQFYPLKGPLPDDPNFPKAPPVDSLLGILEVPAEAKRLIGKNPKNFVYFKDVKIAGEPNTRRAVVSIGTVALKVGGGVDPTNQKRGDVMIVGARDVSLGRNFEDQTAIVLKEGWYWIWAFFSEVKNRGGCFEVTRLWAKPEKPQVNRRRAARCYQ